MKFLVLATCLSLSRAGGLYGGLVGHPNGAVVPVDEPTVAAAKANHLAAYGAAGIANSAIAAPAYQGYAAGYGYAGSYGYAGAQNLNTQLVAHPNGAVVPADEPAVAAARAQHFAAGGGRAAPIVAAQGYAAGYGYAPAYGYSGTLNLNTQLVAHPNGAVVPADEPAVAAARANHFAAGGGRAAPILAA